MILIILPVHNESKTIKETSKDLSKWVKDNLRDTKILFINDGSTDNTEKILKLNKFNVIRNNFDRGKGSALKSAYIFTSYSYKLKDNDLIVFMDGDGQINPKEIKTFLKLMYINDADVVIGNKRHPHSLTKYSLRRKIVSKTYNFIIRLLFGIEYRDTQAGIKVFTKKSLDEIIDKITCKRFAFDLELIVSLRDNGFRVIDAPITLKKQINSGSVRLSSIINTFCDTISIWFRLKKGYYSG